jgi:hypothetical protein
LGYEEGGMLAEVDVGYGRLHDKKTLPDGNAKESEVREALGQTWVVLSTPAP